MNTAVSSTMRSRVRTLSILLTLLIGAVLLSLAVPAVQAIRLSRECSELGGALDQSTEAVEPLVVGRTVFHCVGPGGHVLKSW